MANDKLYIIDENNVTMQVFETDATQITSINDDAPALIKIYEPGQRGPKGDDGGQYVPPANIVSSSAQIASDISGSFISASNSLSNRIAVFETIPIFSSSQQVNFSDISGSFLTSSFLQNNFTSSYYTFTSSIELKVQRLESVTSSFATNSSTSSLLNNSYSASADLRIGRLEAGTSSYALKTEVSGAFTTTSASLAGRLSTYDGKTLISGSAQIASDISGSITSISSSFANRIYSLEQVTGSLNNFTGSANSRFASHDLTTGSLNLFTASIQSEVNNLKTATSSYERTGRGIVSSSQQINTLIPNIVSGSSQINTGSFSGSFYGNGANITGVISSSYALTASYVSGSSTSAISASYAATASYVVGYVLNSQTSSMSVLSASYAPGSTLPSNVVSSSAQLSSDISGSFTALSGSLSNRIYSLEQTTGSLNTFTASIQSEVNNLKTATGSLNSRFISIEATTGSLNLYTGSSNTRFNFIESTTGSLNTFTGSIITRVFGIEATTGSLNIFTGSINLRVLGIEAKTGSYATTGSNNFIGTQAITGSVNVTGSLNVVGQVSGTFVGNGSGLTGIVATSNPAGPDQSIQFNDGGATSGSSDLLFDKILRVLKLSGATTINAITSSGNIDNYLQINLQNKSNATTASSDIVATNDTGTEIGNYIDMGINGSGYNQPQFLGKANDGYLYTTGSKLIIGNITPANHPSSSIDFVVGGPNASQNVRMTISSSGLVSASAFAGDGSRLTNVGGGITAGQAIAFAIALG